MSTATALQPVNLSAVAGPAANSISDLRQLGQVFAKSGFFSDVREEAQAIVKIMAGGELGFPPITSMTGIYIVKGKVSLSANLMAARVKSSGKYDFRVKEMSATKCAIEFFQNGESIGVSDFTIEDAKKAGTQNIDKFPRNMLYARAMSNGCKWFCPDIFAGGIYTPEELGAPVNEDGEVIEMAVAPARTPLRAVPAKTIEPEQGELLASPAIAAEIEQLWPVAGYTSESGSIIPLADYLLKMKQVASPSILPAESANVLLGRLRARAAEKALQPATTPKAFDWQCDEASAAEIDQLTKDLLADGVTQEAIDAELGDFIASDRAAKVELSTITDEQAQGWIGVLQSWVTSRGAAE